MNDVAKAVIAIGGARVSFGAVRALDGVDLRVMPGECVGLVGHNGAGKSTIVSVINGGLTPHEGTVASDGEQLEHYGINAARARGVRCVFQELSLCPNLSIVENCRIMHRNLGGFGWRTRASKVIGKSLDTIFPGHDIDTGQAVGDLSIAERQMVEIAMAFSNAGIPPRLVILDEPTSSLDASLARQMLDHVRRFIASGGSVIFISHILHEILETCDRIVVMKDGRVVAERPANGFDHHGLVEVMGSVAKAQTGQRSAREQSAAPVILSHPTAGLSFTAGKGEIICLAGLAGHGQTKLLLALHATNSSNWLPERNPLVTFVAGDRRLNGVFELWSILRNFSVASLADISRRGLIPVGEEETKGADWKRRIEIRSPDMNNHNILSLSGGNQQKVLFARALATRAPVVLMDDPMRGVDVGTKQEVYEIIRQEAARGRTFIWYSTEMDEVRLCDRVYVFREDRITAELAGDAVNETNIIAASFEAAAA